METPVRVLGLGNVLMGDDGLGPSVVHHLETHFDFPPAVTVLDTGTPGLDLVPFLFGAESVILVDTVRAEGAPGEIRIYRKDDILRHVPTSPRVSPHDPGLKETLLSLEFGGRAPADVVLVGVIPGRVEKSIDLSPPVRAAIPEAARAVLAELERLGQPGRPREHPDATPPWWQTPPGP